MRRVAGYSFFVLCAIFVGVFLFLNPSLKAQDAADWITGNLEAVKILTIEDQEQAMSHPNCQPGEKFYYAWNDGYTSWNGQDQYNPKKIFSRCWLSSGGWSFTSDGAYFVREGDNIGYRTDRVQEMYNEELLDVSNFNSWIGDNSKKLIFVNKPSTSFSVYNNQKFLKFDLTGNRWIVHDTSGSERIDYYGSSLNRKWMVLQANDGIYRLNIETKEMVAFATKYPIGGSGSSYSLNISVTDDGRYALLSGRDNLGGSKTVKVYDIESCRVADVNNLSSSNCMTRDLTSVLGLTASSYLPVNMRFTPDGDQITYYTYYVKPGADHASFEKRILSYRNSNQLDYLALGDSFSSGEGELEGSKWYRDGTDRNGDKYAISRVDDSFPYKNEACHQSLRSYPYILRDSSSVLQKFGDVACSGSKSYDILGAIQNGNQYFGNNNFMKIYSGDIGTLVQGAIDNKFPGRAAQLEFISKYHPRVVTIGIGGNDIDFAGKLAGCVSSWNYTCDTAGIDRYRTGYEIRGMFKKYVNTFSQMKDASMTTKFYAVGYPQFISIDQSCNQPNVVLDRNERIYIHNSITYLNQVIKAAAQQSGFIYLDVENALQGHEICSFDQYANGVMVGNDTNPIAGVNTVASESFHPNSKGHQAMAQAILAKMGSESLSSYDPCASVICPYVSYGSAANIPAIPNYFLSDTTDNDSIVSSIGDYSSEYISQGIKLVSQGVAIGYDLSKSYITNTTFKPGTVATLFIHSEPRKLASSTVDAQGNVTLNSVIPADMPIGSHVITVEGTAVTNEPIVLYQNIYVYKDINDINSDGIPDSNQSCSWIAPTSGVDQDRDGVDDACDGYINPDSTPPVVTGMLQAVPNSDGWINQNSIINWKATDDIDGSTLLQPAVSTVDREGENTYISDKACDRAGNCSTGTVTTKLDKTAPIIGRPSWTINPKRITESSQMSLTVADVTSGIKRVEYYIGDTDPGKGNGAPVTVQNGIAVAENSTDYPLGVFKLTIRALDNAGNWSEPVSGYLVVYDPSSGMKLRGSKTVEISSSNGQNLPWLDTAPTKATFGMSARYDSAGRIVKNSDFQFGYIVGGDCKKQKCHSVELNATSIDWLTLNGINRAEAVFSGSGILQLDGVAQTVKFMVRATDGEKLSLSAKDSFSLSIYQNNATSPTIGVSPVTVERGNIKVVER